MDRQGFFEYNINLSPENSGKADSYTRAIDILDEVLVHQSVIDLRGQSLFDISDVSVIENVLRVVKDEVAKMKNDQDSIFDYGRPNQRSYPLRGFCTAALKSLIEYAQHDSGLDFVAADRIVARETNPQSISKKLISHFDIAREGEDAESIAKQRRGQEYFRRMILSNYRGKCALTGIDIPQLLLASHIIPWADASHKKQRLNPCNGICLSALYDKAFDKGLITISPDNFKVYLSSALREYEDQRYYDKHFRCISGQKIAMPVKYMPSRDFLDYHRNHVFLGN